MYRTHNLTYLTKHEYPISVFALVRKLLSLITSFSMSVILQETLNVVKAIVQMIFTYLLNVVVVKGEKGGAKEITLL